jgi:hypothetical protein
LPEYDVYVMGFREREHLIRESVKAQIAAERGRYDGPAGRLTRAQRSELEDEADRIGAFVGLEPVLVVQ